MRSRQMHDVMTKELEHIPRGTFEQNLLRAMYNIERRHSLASRADAGKEDALAVSIEDVRRSAPGFQPAYDGDFFALTC